MPSGGQSPTGIAAISASRLDKLHDAGGCNEHDQQNSQYERRQPESMERLEGFRGVFIGTTRLWKPHRYSVEITKALARNGATLFPTPSAAWFLERRYSKRYGRREYIQDTPDLREVSEEELDKLVAEGEVTTGGAISNQREGEHESIAGFWRLARRD